MEQTHTLAPQQAKTLAEKVSAYNDAFREMVGYFAAVCDGLGLPPTTAFVSVDPDTGVLTVAAAPALIVSDAG